jgi:hypothetical protein
MILRVGFVATLLVVVSCTEEDIVLGTVPDTGDTHSQTTGTRCTTSTECGEGAFCSRRECKEPAGTCEPFPVRCDEDDHPHTVCGCDGVTYFSDCLRKAAGVTSAQPGECGASGAAELSCGAPGQTCPAGAFCFAPTGSCKVSVLPIHGRCWVIPAKPEMCPATSDLWKECKDGEELPHCVSTCEAIASGKLYVRAHTCQP